MEAKEAKTIADILEEMRRWADESVHNVGRDVLRRDAHKFCDRIEAAWKREIVSRRSIKIPIEIMLPRNAAALREALIKARKAICHHANHVCQSLSWENSNIQSNCADILCSHRDLCEAKTAINAALSKPPRNCDVGTAEEQDNRMTLYCQTRKCESCPLWDNVNNGVRCEFTWAQIPYEEGE